MSSSRFSLAWPSRATDDHLPAPPFHPPSTADADFLRGLPNRFSATGAGSSSSSSDLNPLRPLRAGPAGGGDGSSWGSHLNSFGSGSGAGVSSGAGASVAERREAAPEPAAPAAAGSRGAREAPRPALVELSDDSDDDIVFTGQTVGGVRTASASPGRDLNRLMAHRAANRPDGLPQRPNLSPSASPAPAPAPRPRINFGGAVLQSGNRRHSFLPAPSASVPHPHPPAPLQNPQANPAHRQVQPHPSSYHHLLARREELAPMDFIGMGHPGMGVGVLFGRMGDGAGAMIGIGVGGPAGRREEDVEAILKTVETPKYDDPAPGFTRNFDVADAQTAASPIVINDEGEVVRSRSRGQKRKRPHLACAQCDDQLLISEAYRSPADRVWALRCGHVVDQKCLDEVMVPKTPAQVASVDRHPEVLDEPRKVRRGAARKGRKVKVQEPKPDEYRWVCPVSGCGERHVSWDIGGTWVNKEGEGAIAVYA
ncbi:hypothetical protein IAT38_001806 [Cryptococcus sp. DSM 104549]